MTPLVFADLDDTLFQTRRKIADPSDLTTASLAGDGDPAKTSFMTPRQKALVDWLLASTELIPVTARSRAAFDRVQIGWQSWAILSNGAVILEPGGTPHAPWQAEIAARLAPHAPTLDRLLEEGRNSAQTHALDMRSWIVRDADLASYVVFKLNGEPEGDALDHLTFTGIEGWTRHRNGNNLALIPPGAGKAPALAYLLDHLAPGARPVLTAGDSLSDLGFMGLGDFALIPRASQIARTRL